MIFLRFAANGMSNVEVAAAGTHDRLMIDASSFGESTITNHLLAFAT
jgi:hypothetical protein